MRSNPHNFKLNEHQKTLKSGKLHFFQTSHGLNLTSHKINSRKPRWSQIDMRWNLTSHQSEILRSLIFFVIGEEAPLNLKSFLFFACWKLLIELLFTCSVRRNRSGRRRPCSLLEQLLSKRWCSRSPPAPRNHSLRHRRSILATLFHNNKELHLHGGSICNEYSINTVLWRQCERALKYNFVRNSRKVKKQLPDSPKEFFQSALDG